MFSPDLAVGTTPAASASIAVTTSVQPLAFTGGNGGLMRLVNTGTASIAWSYGASANLTMTNGVVMNPNTTEYFVRPAGVTQLTVIGSAAGSVLTISTGNGL